MEASLRTRGCSHSPRASPSPHGRSGTTGQLVLATQMHGPSGEKRDGQHHRVFRLAGVSLSLFPLAPQIVCPAFPSYRIVPGGATERRRILSGGCPPVHLVQYTHCYAFVPLCGRPLHRRVNAKIVPVLNESSQYSRRESRMRQHVQKGSHPEFKRAGSSIFVPEAGSTRTEREHPPGARAVAPIAYCVETRDMRYTVINTSSYR